MFFAGEAKILVDCGMVQGAEFADQSNRAPFEYKAKEIDTLLISHAHLDHVGRIPKLVREGFEGTIYSTPQTKALAELVLNDAVNILAEEAKHSQNKPLYDKNDVDRIWQYWREVPYHQAFDIKENKVVFRDAGHILGSAMIEISNSENKILFTGDLGNSPAPLLRDTEEVGDVDCLVMESVYGDRNHESKEKREVELERIIKNTVASGGALVIPTFAIDRTQVLLYELNNLVEQKRVPSIPIFVDSPMAIKATDIYKANHELFNEKVRIQIEKGDDIFAFPRLRYTVASSQSKAIELTESPKIILAGSGMSVGGRVIGHEEKHLPDPKSTILLVGYQTLGSLGRRLSDGDREVTIHGKHIKVKAKIETLYGYSAHKDSDHLVQFVSTATDRLKRIFVAMGEPKASMHLAQRLNLELGIRAEVPEINRVYNL